MAAKGTGKTHRERGKEGGSIKKNLRGKPMTWVKSGVRGKGRYKIAVGDDPGTPIEKRQRS